MPGVPDIKLIRTDTSLKNIVMRSTTLVPQGLRGVCVCEVLHVIIIFGFFIFSLILQFCTFFCFFYCIYFFFDVFIFFYGR